MEPTVIDTAQPVDVARVRELIARTAVYVPADCEGIRVDYTDDHYFTGTGEESGEVYSIEYAEVDLENDLLYELTLINR